MCEAFLSKVDDPPRVFGAVRVRKHPCQDKLSLDDDQSDSL